LKFVHKPVKRSRLLDRIQILSLNVLDQRHFQRKLVWHLANDH